MMASAPDGPTAPIDAPQLDRVAWVTGPFYCLEDAQDAAYVLRTRGYCTYIFEYCDLYYVKFWRPCEPGCPADESPTSADTGN
jgi:hypothetical protein